MDPDPETLDSSKPKTVLPNVVLCWQVLAFFIEDIPILPVELPEQVVNRHPREFIISYL
jgi:hypothetical protein